jgi:phosphoribosylglycinamide formyltransferase-1
VLQLGFLSSHGGSGMRSILRAISGGQLNARGCVLISNNVNAECHAVAAEFGMPSLVLNTKLIGNENDLDIAITRTLHDHGVEVIALSGYMRMLGPRVLARFRNRLLNVHPALLPEFGGKGMYGDRVHEAVLAAGVTKTGATVHIVDEEYDHGPVVARREVPVEATDTVETLRARVMAAEQTIYVDVLQAVSAGTLDLDAIAAKSSPAR